MKKVWKRCVALILSGIMVLGMCGGCGNATNSDKETNKEGDTVKTEKQEDKKTLKVLTLGHSLAVNCGHMLALVAEAEGYDELLVGTLYYSGCSLSQHVKFMEGDESVYNLYVSEVATADVPPVITEGVTMYEAITSADWDTIVMQGGPFEVANDTTYKTGYIQKIQNYVNENKLNLDAKFVWNMIWATPTNNTLRDTYPGTGNNPYYSNYSRFGDDRTTYYNAIIECTKNNILTDDTFAYVIPSATTFQNALSSYLEETDVYRDYAHASDLGCLMGAYTWYCKLAGIDHLEEIKLQEIPKNFLRTISSDTAYQLTDMEKAIILESVNNALAKPMEMTQSQYTERPAQ